MRYLLVILLVIPILLHAQDFHINNPGVRARSMAGAYIGIADDATAAFWNPAGLAYNRNYEVYLSGIYKDYWISSGIEDFYTEAYNNYHWNDAYFSFKFPFSFKILGHRLMLNGALAFHEIIDFNYKYRAITFSEIQSGGINAYTAAVGYPYNDKLYFGFSYNLFWGDRNLKFKDLKDGYWGGNSAEAYKYFGYGCFLNLGILYTPKPFRLGLIIKSPYRLKEEADNYKSLIQMPWILGIGVVYNFSNSLAYSADFEWREYKNLKRKFEKPFAQYQIGDEERLGSKNIFQVRLGSEYIVKSKSFWMPLRIGIGIAPKMYTDLNGNKIKGSFFTAGLGFIFDYLTIDCGIEYNKTPYTISNQAGYEEKFWLYMFSVTCKKTVP